MHIARPTVLLRRIVAGLAAALAAWHGLLIGVVWTPAGVALTALIAVCCLGLLLGPPGSERWLGVASLVLVGAGLVTSSIGPRRFAASHTFLALAVATVFIVGWWWGRSLGSSK